MKSARGARPTVLTAPALSRKVSRLSGSELCRIHIEPYLIAARPPTRRSWKPSRVCLDYSSLLDEDNLYPTAGRRTLHRNVTIFLRARHHELVGSVQRRDRLRAV